jgi:hypothetical protein
MHSKKSGSPLVNQQRILPAQAIRNVKSAGVRESRQTIHERVSAGERRLLRNSRKTECGAKQFLAGLVVRAPRFAL